MPELKGSGARVIKQKSAPRKRLDDKNGGKMDYILWLSELLINGNQF